MSKKGEMMLNITIGAMMFLATALDAGVVYLWWKKGLLFL